MPDNMPSLEEVERIASVCHGANRAYSELLGDHSHLSWARTQQDLRHSVQRGVMFLASHPEAGPQDSHAEWVRYKKGEGWEFGMTKDAQKKTHPDLVAWDQLAPFEQKKDRIFCAIVRILLTDGTQG